MIRVFKGWKKIQIRKRKVLKNIISRKCKMEKFLSAILFARWKLKVSSLKIERMVSNALLRS
jgi:hypothetical protein